MKLKLTFAFILVSSVAVQAFKLTGNGGYYDRPDQPDEEEPKPTEVVEKGESAEASEEHVEHPIPPSGPISRIVLVDLDALNAQKAESKEDVEDDDDKVKESTTEKLEKRHFMKGSEVEEKTDADDVKVVPLTGSVEDISLQKKELKDDIVNAFHHSVAGDRKEYFRHAVSKMSKDELDDLHHALLAALKPLPDDDVKVEDVKEEFKEVVHEFVEKQGGSEERKEALIEIEHVLEEAKPEEEAVPEKQVIKSEDWKKENVVGGIVKADDKDELPKPVEEEKETPKETETVEETAQPEPIPEEKDEKISDNEEKKEEKEDEVPIIAIEEKKEDEVKDAEVEEKVENVPEVEKKEEEPVIKEDTKESKPKVIKFGVIAGILSKDQEEMLERRNKTEKKMEEVRETILDSVIQADDNQDEVVDLEGHEIKKGDITVADEKEDDVPEASVPVEEEVEKDVPEDEVAPVEDKTEDDIPEVTQTPMEQLETDAPEEASSTVTESIKSCDDTAESKVTPTETEAEEKNEPESQPEEKMDKKMGWRRGTREKRHSRHYYHRHHYNRTETPRGKRLIKKWLNLRIALAH